jgi:hypothetical protein
MELFPKDIMCLSLIQEQLDIKRDALTLPPVPSLRKEYANHMLAFL